MKKKIPIFFGRFRFLSNFYFFSPGITSEHLFQSYKTTNKKHKKLILSQKTPREAKLEGKRVALRDNWDIIKDKKMEKALKIKFVKGSLMAEMLISTKKAKLIEGNTWHDNYWGNCLCLKCRNIKGKNKLGKLLMKRRSKLNGKSS